MTDVKHGLSIGIQRTGEQFFLTLSVSGMLTHDDYKVVTPMIESALKGVNQPLVNVFIDASELKGWELRTAWDDLKLGYEQGHKFKKIAIYGYEKWQEIGAKVAEWFISGDVKFFDQSKAALAWLDEE